MSCKSLFLTLMCSFSALSFPKYSLASVSSSSYFLLRCSMSQDHFYLRRLDQTCSLNIVQSLWSRIGLCCPPGTITITTITITQILELRTLVQALPVLISFPKTFQPNLNGHRKFREFMELLFQIPGGNRVNKPIFTNHVCLVPTMSSPSSTLKIRRPSNFILDQIHKY